jgi:hypothetical protein
MPLLTPRAGLLARARPAAPDRAAAPDSGVFSTCANPGCGSGWLHLLRGRGTPVFEGGWTCSAVCTEATVRAALERELDGRTAREQNHRHRVPLGLVMLEQGWISAGQLRQALDAQRTAGSGRLGQWLMGLQGIDERQVTRALGLQWSCPVLALESHDPQALAALVPRFFVDAFAALPLRVAAGKLLYLGFEDRLDPVLALAVERMTGMRVESGLVRASQFGPARARMLEAKYPPVELVEAVSKPAAAQAMARAVERVKPAASCLVRVHDYLWLRLWRSVQSGPAPESASVQDLICSVGTL